MNAVEVYQRWLCRYVMSRRKGHDVLPLQTTPPFSSPHPIPDIRAVPGSYAAKHGTVGVAGASEACVARVGVSRGDGRVAPGNGVSRLDGESLSVHVGASNTSLLLFLRRSSSFIFLFVPQDHRTQFKMAAGNTMDAIKKKMMAMKIEKENALDKSDQLDQKLSEQKEINDKVGVGVM